jgi:NhaP-type Na+/H+ or K+/H+ antiporter
MNPPLDLTLQIILTVVAGIGAQVLAEFLQLPGIIFLLLFGILLGPSGLHWLHPQLLGDGLEVIVALLVAIVLFEGGFSLRWQDLWNVSSSLRNLVTLGTCGTLVGGAVAAHWLSEFPWPLAFLYASLVVVTGPTVVNSLLKQVKVDRQVSVLLEGEGVLIDPIGAILAVAILNVVLSGNPNPVLVLQDLSTRLGIGAGIGTLGGWLIGLLLKRGTFLSDDLRTLVVLAGVLGLFGLAQTLQNEAGLMAVVAAGLVLRALDLSEERLVKRFKGQLTTLSIAVLFILLSADLSVPSMLALGWEGVGTIAVLMLVVRPLNVWFCTRNSIFTWQQKLFIAWMAPRGIVSASVASLFAILLTQGGINGGDTIKALVFLTIIITVFLQSSTSQWLANLLGITPQQATGILIAGANPLSLLLARLFLDHGEFVVLITADPDAANLKPRENLAIVVSTALDHDVLERVKLDSLGTFLAITDNGEVNAMTAQRAAEEFGPSRVAAVFPREGNQQGTVKQALSERVSLKTWNDYIQDGAVRLGETVLRPEEAQQAHLQALIEAGNLLPLVVQRAGQLQVVTADLEWLEGDRLTYLLYDPKPKLLKLLSGGSQTVDLIVETVPEVEAVAMEG